MNAAIASVVGAIDLLTYYTSAQTDAAITAALVPVALNNAPEWTAKPEDHQCAAEPALRRAPERQPGQYWTRTESDSRYFVQTANAGFKSLIKNNVSPPTIRALLPRAPLSTNVLFSSTTLELLCDAPSKAEADGRHAQSGNLTSLDSVLRDHGQRQLHVPGCGTAWCRSRSRRCCAGRRSRSTSSAAAPRWSCSATPTASPRVMGGTIRAPRR